MLQTTSASETDVVTPIVPLARPLTHLCATQAKYSLKRGANKGAIKLAKSCRRRFTLDRFLYDFSYFYHV